MADREAFEVVSIDPTEEFMLNEALDQARMDILYHIEREYYEKGVLIVPRCWASGFGWSRVFDEFQRGDARGDLSSHLRENGV